MLWNHPRSGEQPSYAEQTSRRRLALTLLFIASLGAYSTAFATLVNLETGEGYRPTIDEDGDLEDPPDWVHTDRGDLPPDDTFAGSVNSTVTIHGKVFYNDRRKHGLFSARRTPANALGTRCDPDGFRDDGITRCSENWLGAQYMVIDVIELDEGYFAPTAWDCVQEDKLASVAVNNDGTFTATFTPTDPCDSDAVDQPAIALRVRLRFCGEWCFSVNDENGEPYALYYPGASANSPLLVEAGDEIELPAMNFNPAGTNPAIANDTAIAANYYASLVDTVLTLHRDNDIPFYKEGFDEVFVDYPSTQTGSATALSPTEIALVDKNDWVKGEVVAHEYGHVVMMRAWDGDYGWDGVGNGGVSWNANTPTEQRIAFKEAWGNFISRAVFTETMAYDDPSFDDNETYALSGDLGQGSRVVRNINKLLSDWYDSRPDDDPSLAGAGDHFSASLYSMWYNLRRMYVDVNAYGGDFEAGLTICDYVDYYLDVRKSASAVGTTDHNNYVDSITDLIYNNNIACYRPSP